MERIPPCELPDTVARLCHQIRNPLATIQSGVQLVQVLTRPAGEAAECLETALAEVARIEAMLRDAHHLVRLAPGVSLKVDLAEVARRTAEGHRSGAAARGMDLDGPSELWVSTAPELVQLALDELLARAMQVTPAGGTVHVRWGEHGSDGVALEVEDGGTCAAPQDPERTVRALMTAWPGSGLGLCLAERACALLGGHLDWTRLHPEGCRFRITLPRG